LFRKLSRRLARSLPRKHYLHKQKEVRRTGYQLGRRYQRDRSDLFPYYIVFLFRKLFHQLARSLPRKYYLHKQKEVRHTGYQLRKRYRRARSDLFLYYILFLLRKLSHQGLSILQRSLHFHKWFEEVNNQNQGCIEESWCLGTATRRILDRLDNGYFQRTPRKH